MECKEQIRTQRKIAKQYANNDEVQFLCCFLDTVEYKDDGRLEFISGYHSIYWENKSPTLVENGFEHFIEAREVAEQFNSFLMPGHYVVDQNGVVVKLMTSSDIEAREKSLEDSFTEAIEELLMPEEDRQRATVTKSR